MKDRKEKLTIPERINVRPNKRNDDVFEHIAKFAQKHRTTITGAVEAIIRYHMRRVTDANL